MYIYIYLFVKFVPLDMYPIVEKQMEKNVGHEIVSEFR